MFVVGIGGPPGAGKSTLAAKTGGLVISLDDFYLSKADRAVKGLAWRGLPGSHDVDTLVGVLRAIRRREAPIVLPRFDAALDDRTDPVTITEVPDLIVVEGWLLGHTGDGYDAILDLLDRFVFLDLDLATAKARRFAREADLRRRGGGFTKRQMQRFWDEVLHPGIERYLPAAKARADIVIAAS